MRANVVVITDPGPDPDDAKVILLLGIAHLGRQISLRAVVCNGGAQARERAGLARCLLDHIGAQRVPVGIGSAGSPTSARPHEFNLPGYAEVDPARLLDGSELLRSALRRSSRKSVRLLCIASMRDAADLFEREPALVFSRLQRVVIQGGLQRDEATGSWVADSAVNNGFDMQAANAVYAACQQSGLPMTVVSRHAVPLLPMQLANSFALRTECPVMRYLADAQSLGLRGLWSKLCAGQLPARCTKQWYFETFCGVDASEFAQLGFDRLDDGDDIGQHLDGFVKPYDVIAAMGVLDESAPLLREAAIRSTDVALHASKHTLLLEPQQMVGVEHVIHLLRATYHAVVETTAARERASRQRTRLWMGSQVERVPLRTSHTGGAQTAGTASSAKHGAMRVLPVEPSGARTKSKTAFVAADLATNEELALRDALRAARAHAAAARLSGGHGDNCLAATAKGSCGGANSSRAELDGVGEAVVRLLALSERRVFALLRALSACALCWGGCSLVALLSYFLLAGRLARYSDNGESWATANALTLVIQFTVVVAMLFVPAIPANLVRIRVAVGVTLLSSAAASSVFYSVSSALFTGELRDGVLPLWKEFGQRAVEANQIYLGMQFACGLGIFCACSLALVAHWHSPERLVADFWRWWSALVLSGAVINWSVTCLLHAYAVYRAHNLMMAHFVHLAELCVGALAASRSVRVRMQARISRALASRASFWCSLALLSGVGGLCGSRSPRALVAEATRSFCAHAQQLPELDKDSAPSQDGSQDSGELLAALIRGGGALDLVSRAASFAVKRPSTRLSTERAASTFTFADAYVLHAPARDEVGAHALAAALRSWASRFELAHGRPPVVYVETLSHDVSLEPLERLQHMPTYLARCERLVILLTREIFDDPRRVGVCMAWAALGCGVDQVDVELAEVDAFAMSAAVGALDAFKMPPVQATTASEEGAAIHAAHLAFELTGEALVRSTVYELVPLCVDAAKRSRRTKSQSSLSLTQPESLQ